MKNPEKLIASKMRAAETGRFLTGNADLVQGQRIPPGQGLVKGLPVLDLGITPEIDVHAWRLTLDGCVEAPVILDHAAIEALPQTLIKADIHCVTSWTRLDSQWQGVLLADLLMCVKINENVAHVLLHSDDGYTVNLRLSDLYESQSMLAHQFDGEPLSAEHGGPYRLVIPTLYFWKSPKWLTRIEFLEEKIPGFWEQRGYHDIGDPWREERYGPKQTLPKPPSEPAPEMPVVVSKPSIWKQIKIWWTTYI